MTDVTELCSCMVLMGRLRSSARDLPGGENCVIRRRAARRDVVRLVRAPAAAPVAAVAGAATSGVAAAGGARIG